MQPWQPPERFNLADYFLGDRIREGRGDRTALRLADRNWSYAEVQDLAATFAAALTKIGAEVEERVVLALPDGPEYVGALFGILASGGVVVMVNPALPAGELAAIFDYVRPRTAIIGEEAAATLTQATPELVAATAGVRSLLTVGVPAGAASALATRGPASPAASPMPRAWSPGCVDAASPAAGGAAEVAHRRRVARWEELAGTLIAAGPVAWQPVATHRDDAAIWLFSGGTTGRPKAVVQSHRSYANTTELYAKAFLGYGADDVTLSVPKLFFGYATGSNLFFPFSVGASAVLFADRSTPEAIFREIARHRPTILINVPTLVAQMLEHPAAASQDLSSLRFATSAGEALPVPLYHRFKATFGVELLDGLGTAEMWHVFLSNHPDAVRPGTLGRAVPGFVVEVRDEAGQPLPAGEVGRLWVSGGSRAWGYWQELEKTQEAFRGEWFVGGDLVQMDADGFVTYCGRTDDVLKVGGKWVAPAEVESCLLTHPAVGECAVVGVTDERGLVKPRAYVLVREPTAAEELQAWVRSRLAPHKYPREVVFVEEFPRTHLGKIDRGKLRRA